MKVRMPKYDFKQKTHNITSVDQFEKFPGGIPNRCQRVSSEQYAFTPLATA